MILVEEVTETTQELAGSLHGLGRTERALTVAERALKIREKVHGPDSERVASASRTIAAYHLSQGDLSSARSYYRRALRILRRESGTFDAGLAADWSRWARELTDLLWDAGEHGDAIDFYEVTVRIAEKAGDEHLESALTRYAEMLREVGRDDEAAQHEARAAEIRKRLE